MVSITLLLVAAQHASMAVAGLVVAGYTLDQAVTGPVRGRLADRRGLIPVAVACGTGYALALLALATGIAPAAALGLMLALTGVAVPVIGRQARRPEHGQGQGPRWSVLRSGALRRLLMTAALVNAAVSATEVALTAYVRYHHALWASGPLLAGVSIGSILGSLLLGARVPAAGSEPQDRRRRRRLARLLAGYAGGLALLTVAGLYAPLLAVAAPLAGLCLGPTLATLFSEAASAAPRGGGIQTQAWINSIMNGGAAAGAAVAGAAPAGSGAGRPILALALAVALALGSAASAAITGHAR